MTGIDEIDRAQLDQNCNLCSAYTPPDGFKAFETQSSSGIVPVKP